MRPDIRVNASDACEPYRPIGGLFLASRQPVEPSALAELRQHAAQLRLVGTKCVARPFHGTLFAAGGAKLPHLNALVIR